MQRAQSDDEDAFAQLLRRYERPLFQYLCRFSGNAADAEDLFQETFLKAYKHRALYCRDRPFRPWVYQIATNMCRDRLRWRIRKAEVSLDAPLRSDASDGGTFGDPLASGVSTGGTGPGSSNGAIPIMWGRVPLDDWEFSHRPAGTNVLHQDGHVQFVPYSPLSNSSNFPATYIAAETFGNDAPRLSVDC